MHINFGLNEAKIKNGLKAVIFCMELMGGLEPPTY